MRILLVDDHHDTLKILSRLLAMDDHEVAVATSIAEARRLCENRTFDLLIGDISLPDGSGLDLMRDLKAGAARLKGIAFSGHASQDHHRSSRDAGYSEHVNKPCSIDDLRMAIRRVSGQGNVV